MSYTPVSQLNDLYPTACPHLLAVRAEYATWNWYAEKGYIRYSRGAHERTSYEHQMVAERAYGPVPQGYHVHHVDETKTNNSAENLRYIAPKDHTFTHKFSLSLICYCPTCGKRFERTIGQVEPSVHQVFCSRQCKALAERRVQRPGQDELGRLLKEVANWSAIGRRYGVSDNAVRKWARSYGLVA